MPWIITSTRTLARLPVGDVVAVDLRPPGGDGLTGQLGVGRTETGQRHHLGIGTQVDGVTGATGCHGGQRLRAVAGDGEPTEVRLSGGIHVPQSG